MTRDLTAPVLAEVQAKDHRLAFLFYAEFEGGAVRLCSGQNAIVWGGHSWLAAGDLIGISDIEEHDELVVTSVTVTLSGANPAIVSAAIQSARANMPGLIYLAFLDDAGQVVPEPYVAFEGVLSEPQIELGPDTATIAITYESHDVELLRPREWRYTPESHKVRHPNDRGFDFVSGLQDKPIKWLRN